MIEQVDFLVRVVAVGATLMLIAQLVAGELRETVKYPLVALMVGAMAYLIQSSAMLMSEGPIQPWVDLVAIATPFWIWLLGRRLFGAEPQRRIALGALAVLLIGWVVENFVPGADKPGFYLHQLAGLALVGDLLRVGLARRKASLDGPQGAVALWLPLAAGALAGAILLTETIGEETGIAALVRLTIAVLVLLLTLFAGLALMRIDEEWHGLAEHDHGEEAGPVPVRDPESA